MIQIYSYCAVWGKLSVFLALKGPNWSQQSNFLEQWISHMPKLLYVIWLLLTISEVLAWISLRIWCMDYYVIKCEYDRVLLILCQQVRLDKPSLQTCPHPQPYKICPQAVRFVPSLMLFPSCPHDWSLHNLPEPTNCLPPYPWLSCHKKQDRIKMYDKMNTIGVSRFDTD